MKAIAKLSNTMCLVGVDMFAHDDETYLLRKIGRNEVVLFLGAGFSTDVTARNGQALPTSKQLAEAMWRFLDYEEPYDETTLAELYDCVLQSGRSHSEIRQFLERTLLSASIPDWYDTVALPYWYRIYTTNVDDVLERTFLRASRRLEILSYPADDISERDQFLQAIQAVHLNGRLPCQPTDVTFSVSQYARAAGRPNPLYEQFVRDYSTSCTVFVGSNLNEPLLWQAVEARSDRNPEDAEYRPKSFLVAPRISPAKRDLLAGYNVVPVVGDTRQFLDWLAGVVPGLPTRFEILRLFEPTMMGMIESKGALGTDLPDLQEFSRAFHRVTLPETATSGRSLYLLGASPRWEDLFAELDAPRDLTDELLQEVQGPEHPGTEVKILAVLGSAGAGKSTILRRLGIRLVQAGRSVYLTNSEALPRGRAVRKAIELHDDRVVLLLDNAEVALGWLPELVDGLAGLERSPIVVLACRTNDFDRLSGRFPDSMRLVEYPVKNLNRREIESVIAKLERSGLLGRLQGLTLEAQVREFEGPARRQILVAMREATSGLGFDQIIENEFQTLACDETRVLYLCVALATDVGYRISKDEFVGCSTQGPSAGLNILMRGLRDVVFLTGPREDLLLLRHRRIAEHMVSVGAPRGLLREAYVRLVRVLATQVRQRPWRSREFSLYRSLINHRTVYERFSGEIDEARVIYESLKAFFAEEAQFWLQFGNLELEGRGGSLELAENYINQAFALAPFDPYVCNARGHVLLRKAIDTASRTEALSLLAEGSAMLQERMEETALSDAYAVHIYCSQRFGWMRKWHYLDDEAQREELESLRSILAAACNVHFRNRRLGSLRSSIERAYLQLAMPRGQRQDVVVDD